MKIFGFAGYSGSGKTTLIEKLVPLFMARRIAVSLIKHAHHTFDIDKQGKDSYRHRQVGCAEVLVTSSRRWALMHELRGAPEPELAQHVERMSACDLLLVEGYKRERIPKLEVYRSVIGEPMLHPHDDHIVAIASDVKVDSALPQFHINDPVAIADFILAHVGISRETLDA